MPRVLVIAVEVEIVQLRNLIGDAWMNCCELIRVD